VSILWGVSYAVQAALVLLFGAIAVCLLRSRSAALRHLAWACALALTLLLPLVTLAWTDPPVPLRLPITVAARAQTAAGDATTDAEPGLRSGRPGDLWRAAIEPARWSATRWIVAIWIAGSVFAALRVAVVRLRLSRWRRSLTVVDDPRTLALLFDVSLAAGARRSIPLFASERTTAPVALGVLRPAIVLPASWEEWKEPVLRVALMHEVFHVHRRDAATQLLAELVRVAHWFDPLAWIAARALARERERACDEAVLRLGVDATEYASAILAAARAAGSASPRGALALAQRRGSVRDLEARLRSVLDERAAHRSSSRGQKWRLITTLTAATAAVACLGFAPWPALPSLLVLDDPRSELLPDTGARSLDTRELASARDREAIERLSAGARRVKTSYADLVGERSRWALSRIEDGEVVEPLIDSLSDPDWRVQAYAAWGLAVAGDDRAVEPVRPLLDHPVWRVRAQALSTLVALDAELSPPSLAEMAADPAWQVRISVVEYFERHPDLADGGLLARLAADGHTGVRNAALSAIDSIASTH
jgi:beta-lactamase regulating signal transducer with metallopeptidase domain